MIGVSERHQTRFHVTGSRKPVRVGLFGPRDGDLSQSPAPRASELRLLHPTGWLSWPLGARDPGRGRATDLELQTALGAGH